MKRLMAILAVVLSAKAAAFQMTDSLKGSTVGNPIGGSFGPQGWTVTGKADRLWYEIPTLVEGSIEFTVSNITHANLDVEDNEIFAMYEAGYGMSEPMQYSPQYRENHYKCMIRIYGTPEQDRVGQQKLMWGICPSGGNGYGACGCGSFFEEPFGGDGTWDGTPQRLRVEWKGSVVRYLRNGTEVVRVDWSSSGVAFGPSRLHFSLGTPRATAVSDSQLPVGAIFSDVEVNGVEGSVSSCAGPGPTPDAGPGVIVAPDAGQPVVDAGQPVVDAGQPVVDAGQAVVDAGQADAGGAGGAITSPPPGPQAAEYSHQHPDAMVTGGCASVPTESLAALMGLIALVLRRRR